MKEIFSHNFKHTRIWSMTFSPDERSLIFTTTQQYIGRVHLPKFTIARLQTIHTAPVFAIARCGNYIATAGADMKIRLWKYIQETTHFKSVTAYQVSRHPVLWLSITSDIIASGSMDNMVRLWNVNTGQKIGEFCADRRLLWGLCLHPVNKILATCGWEGKIKLWQTDDLTNKLELYTDKLLGLCPLTICFSPDGSLLASGYRTGKIILWKLNSMGSLQTSEPFFITGHKKDVRAMGFSPDATILASGDFDGKISLFDINSGQSIEMPKAHKAPIYCLQFSPSGKLLASGSSDGTIKLWHL